MSDNLQKHRWLSLSLPNQNVRRLVILTGARQTGKPTLAQKIYSDSTGNCSDAFFIKISIARVMYI